MWANLMFFYYADNLKVSNIVSCNFFFFGGGEIVQILCENWLLKLRICGRFAAIFYVVSVAVLTMTWSCVRIAVIV